MPQINKVLGLEDNSIKEMMLDAHQEILDFHEAQGDDENVRQFLLMASSYAKLVMTSLFTLNGGALIALPAIVGTINTTYTDSIISSATAYLIGLIMAVLSGLFGYFSVLNDAKGYRAVRSKRYFSTLKVYFERHFEGHDFFAGDIEVEMDKHIRAMWLSSITAIVALIFIISSLFCFGYGSFSLSQSLKTNIEISNSVNIQ